jgi:hypothetical protein
MQRRHLTHFAGLPPLQRYLGETAIDRNVTASTAARCATATLVGPITRATLTKNWSSRVERQRAPNCDWFLVRSVMDRRCACSGRSPPPVARGFTRESVDLFACRRGEGLGRRARGFAARRLDRSGAEQGGTAPRPTLFLTRSCRSDRVHAGSGLRGVLLGCLRDLRRCAMSRGLRDMFLDQLAHAGIARGIRGAA